MCATTAFIVVAAVGSSAITRPWRSAMMRSRDREHVGQAVADQDDGDALAPQLADQVEHMLDLAHRECRGRLVHDHELGVEGQRAGDRDRLLLAARELADLVADRGDARAEPLDHARRPRARSGRGRSMPSEQPEQASGRLAAEEDVGGDVLLRRQRQVLVDHLDAARADRARLEPRRSSAPSKRDAAGIGAVDAGDASSSASTCRRRCRRPGPPPRRPRSRR